jgi:predicted DCC family thiol-disulfide oxidoreductase YuxK
MKTEQAIYAIIIFDGECNLCERAVQFIIPRDPQKRFRFAANQSEVGQRLLEPYHFSKDQINTIILIRDERLYTKSDAVLQVTRKLSGFWPILYSFVVIPKAIRDPIYQWIARNRYKWFGKKDHCMMPSPDIKSRFLG